MIPDEDWTFCLHCGIPVVTCKKCGNSSCYGGGCPECYEYFGEAIKICHDIQPRLFPPERIEQLKKEAYEEWQKIPEPQRTILEALFGEPGV